MHALHRIASTILIYSLLLHGCGDEAAEQTAGQPGDPIDLPATPEQIAKLEAVVRRFPEVKPLADRAEADGTITEGEILEVFTAAERAKDAGGAE
jgi:hypothetical protein